MTAVDEKHQRIIADIARETGKMQQVLAGIHTDIVAVRNGAAATDLDLAPLLEAVFGKIDLLRRTQRTICSHYESLTGRRALPPQVRPPSPVFRF
jgi:hypothetical protein